VKKVIFTQRISSEVILLNFQDINPKFFSKKPNSGKLWQSELYFWEKNLIIWFYCLFQSNQPSSFDLRFLSYFQEEIPRSKGICFVKYFGWGSMTEDDEYGWAIIIHIIKLSQHKSKSDTLFVRNSLIKVSLKNLVLLFLNTNLRNT